MRNFSLSRFNRGWNIVSPLASMDPRQLAKAQNAVYTKESVKRRRGRLASHARTGSNAVSMLKRFYRLATTGAISRYFLRAAGTALYKADSAWSDDVRSLVASWTQIPFPNIGNNSLYDEHETAAHTISSGAIQDSFSSKNWLYLIPQYDNSDDLDAAYPKNAPIRTDGTKSFLMGLAPPAQLAGSDADSIGIPSAARWDATPVLSGAPCAGAVSSPLRRSRIDSSLFGYAYKDGSSGSLTANLFDGASWSQAVVTGPVVPRSTALCIDMAYDLSGYVCIAFIETATNDLKFAYRAVGSTGSWTVQTIDSGTWTQCSMAIDDKNAIHVVATDQSTVVSYWKRGDDGAWPSAETVVSVGADTPTVCVTRDTYIPRVCYVVRSSGDVAYRHKDSGTWSATETVATPSALVAHMALGPDNVPHVAWTEVSGNGYSNRSTGSSWSSPESPYSGIAGLSTGVFIAVAGDGTVAVGLDDYPVSGGEGILSTRESGVWYSDAIRIPQGEVAWMPTIVVDEANTIYALVQKVGAYDVFVKAVVSPYYYRLTAEYDNNVLGESGPSPATRVLRTYGPAGTIGSVAFPEYSPIGPHAPHTLLLDTGSGDYDMTDDVSRIHIYRTSSGATTDGPYYRVGSVLCSGGFPTSDFVDTVTDNDLVLNSMLNVDRHMPPKFLCGVWWKDRAVIANLKARRTDAAAGSELDLEENGIHKNRVRMSEAFHPDIFPQNFFQDVLPDGDAGSIQQLVVGSRDDSLYVILEADAVRLTDLVGDTVSALSAIPRQVSNSRGTPARFSVVEHEGFIFYVTKNGIEVIDGDRARDITADTIGPLWNLQDSSHPDYAKRINMAQIGLIRGAVKKDSEGERIVWTYPSATSTYCDRQIVLDFARWRDIGYKGDGIFSNWSGWSVSCFSVWDGEGDRGEIFGGEANATAGSWVYRLGIADVDEQGLPGGTVSVGAVAALVVKPGLTDAGTEERRKRFRTVRINGKIRSVANSGACAVAIKADVNDGEHTPTLDTLVWPQGAVQRVSRNYPHTAIAVYAGVEITATDQTPGASGGSPPFELLSISYTVGDMAARTVR